MPFRDYFSKQATDYARYRPGYPAALYEFLASLAPGYELAWDCGTGSGQAAVGLAEYFKKVIATDASREQIDHARPHLQVEYRIEPAEHTTLQANSVDLVTVGVAVHWFDFDPFYAEVRRVAKPGAVIAVWTYDYPIITPAVDSLISAFNGDALTGYWPERIHYLTAHYATLPFPFEPIPSPEFQMQSHWDLNDLIGFVSSWSATQRYLTKKGANALDGVWTDLEKAWGNRNERKWIRWPIYLRAGRVSQPRR